MADSEQQVQKSRESEIDYLLAEEFSCDPEFSARFAKACGLRFQEFHVLKPVVFQPALSEGGKGDLLVKAEMDGFRVALIIEDKIDSPPEAGQAQRYRAEAERMLREGWDEVVTVLVAPSTYQGERCEYDDAVDLESVKEMLGSSDPARLLYRRGIIERALKKKASDTTPDPAMHRLRSNYSQWFENHCGKEGLQCRFPPLNSTYGGQNSWVEQFRAAGFPDHVWLRHRLWTRAGDPAGMVDLIIDRDVTQDEREQLETLKPVGAIIDKYGTRTNGPTGIQVSIKVQEMRQSKGFHEACAAEAFEAMKLLSDCYEKWSQHAVAGSDSV